MYLITNEKGWPVAADDALLKAWEVSDIETLVLKITGEAREPEAFTRSPVTIGNTTYNTETSILHSPFGSWKIHRFYEILKESSDLSAENTEIKFDLVDKAEENKIKEESNDEFIADQELPPAHELFPETDAAESDEISVQPDHNRVTPGATQEEKIEEELIDLLVPTEGEVRVDSLEEVSEKNVQTQQIDTDLAKADTTEVQEARHQTQTTEKKVDEQKTPSKLSSFDAEANAEAIGVDVEDYLHFIDEYRQLFSSLIPQLRHDEETQRLEAADKLLHLAQVLRLEEPASLLELLKSSGDNSILTSLQNIISSYTDTVEEKPAASDQESTELFDLKEEKSQKENYIYDTIDLSDVKPIHFDFTIEEAANDLSLPVELIEEFIQDFIKQARDETEHMIEAYRKGDLETVQKIGHLLKGTSSNLRITPLSNTLYEIQFNEDIDKVPELIRHYWGHFLSLENQMQLLQTSKS